MILLEIISISVFAGMLYAIGYCVLEIIRDLKK